MDMSLKERNLMQVAIDHFIEYQQDVFLYYPRLRL
jgi:hypothetical protein